LCPRIHPSFTNAVSVVSFRNIIPVFAKSRPGVYTFGLRVPYVVCAVATIVILFWMAFFIFGIQFAREPLPGTCPNPVTSKMIPL